MSNLLDDIAQMSEADQDAAVDYVLAPGWAENPAAVDFIFDNDVAWADLVLLGVIERDVDEQDRD